uniref:Candidate secreted effector n=1 Tax=Meloidogyne incognita TaxID=6306 RepID=A0A914KHC4_MELIC
MNMEQKGGKECWRTESKTRRCGHLHCWLSPIWRWRRNIIIKRGGWSPSCSIR